MSEKILVIKLSALGDFILALGAMEAIRKHHKNADITLLTTRPFVDIAQRSGYFNEVITDTRPAFYDVPGWLRLYRLFNKGGYVRVYDLQMNERTGFYYRLFLKKPMWSGIIPGSPLYCARPDLKEIHAFRRHQEALKVAGIDVARPDLSWMQADVSLFGLKLPYVLFVPGSAPQHPAKRWPAQRYGALALKLMSDGYQPVLLGTEAEADVVDRFMKSCPGALDLSGKTSLYDIAALARGAAGAVGNDTGPMHLIAQAGCPSTVLFCTAASNPALSMPVGPTVTALQADDLDDLSVGDVYKVFSESRS